MKEERAIEILEDLKDSTLNIAEDYETALQMGIDALKNRIVARELADNKVKTIRSGKDEYSDINRQND